MNVQTLLSDWNFMLYSSWIRRLHRYTGFETQILSGLLAAFLLYQVVTNTGCCAANGCAIPAKKIAIILKT
jgi:hypothetical protein